MPPSRNSAPAVVPADTARRLLLAGQGLLSDPARRAAPAAVRRQIERMGYVQVDTINVVERAHHHILFSRFDGYRPATLGRLLERDRSLFEHWTHDASVIPAAWLPYWRVRFERFRRRARNARDWWTKRLEGEPHRVLAHVRERIEREGPLMSRDFEHTRRKGTGSWWGWKPQKAALEYLWRSGDLAITRRENFNKVYDLTERVFPGVHEGAIPDDAAHVEWACRTALERLVVATAPELAHFFNAVTLADARAWCRKAAAAGEIEAVVVEGMDGSRPQPAFARIEWRRLGRRPAEPPHRMRLLSPFDPVLRDRRRTLRRFGFDYRFEAFVPAARRRYGYYVLPVLEDDRLVGRVDPKLHREAGELEIRGLWWEPGTTPTAARRRRLREAVEVLAAQVGAARCRLPS